MSEAHKGQIVPMRNQMIPIDKKTTFHANYDYDLNGFNQGEIVRPIGALSALDFNGIDNYIDCGNNNVFATSDALTISVWAYSNGAISGGIVTKGQNAGWASNEYGFRINGNYLTFYISDSNNTAVDQLSYVMPQNTWVHITAVTSIVLGKLQIYVDGKFHSELIRKVNMTNKGYPLKIGQGYSTTFWKGKISDLAIFNAALSPQQIEDTYKNGVDKSNKGLIGYWKLDEKDGTIITDYSNSGIDGIFTGSVKTTYGPTMASIKKEEGKFKGAVLIEPDTENLLTGLYGKSYATETNPQPGFSVAAKIELPPNTYGYVGLNPNIVTSANRTYTLSYFARLVNGLITSGTQIYIGSDTQGQSGVALRNIQDDITNEWKRFVVTGTTDATATSITRAAFRAQTGSTGCTIEIADWQLEERTGVTSYTNSARPVGRLWYPKEIINPAEFTVSCWFNIPYMHNTQTNNGGISGNWYNPLIEIAPTTSKGGVGLSIVAGPNHPTYSKKPMVQLAGGITTASNLTAPTSIEDNTWYHMVCVFNGVTYKLYINSILQQTVTAGATTIEDDYVLMVGGGYKGKPNIMIDELRIESRAISEEEVMAWAESGLHYNYLDYSHYVD